MKTLLALTFCLFSLTAAADANDVSGRKFNCKSGGSVQFAIGGIAATVVVNGITAKAVALWTGPVGKLYVRNGDKVLAFPITFFRGVLYFSQDACTQN